MQSRLALNSWSSFLVLRLQVSTPNLTPASSFTLTPHYQGTVDRQVQFWTARSWIVTLTWLRPQACAGAGSWDPESSILLVLGKPWSNSVPESSNKDFSNHSWSVYSHKPESLHKQKEGLDRWPRRSREPGFLDSLASTDWYQAMWIHGGQTHTHRQEHIKRGWQVWCEADLNITYTIWK